MSGCLVNFAMMSRYTATTPAKSIFVRVPYNMLTVIINLFLLGFAIALDCSSRYRPMRVFK